MTSEVDEEAARALGRLLDPEARSPVNRRGEPPSWQRLGERRLLHAVRGLPRERSFPRAQWVAGIATAACALLAVSLLWSWQPEERALGFVVRGEQALAVSAASASAASASAESASAESASAASANTPPLTRIEGERDRSTWVDFSDGSQLEIHADSSARLQEVRSRGATVVLERGGLGVDVVPAAGASWSVLAGPYEVRVLGTRFTTLWEPREQALSVRLERGSVRIVGTDIQEAVELRPGQRFDVQSGAKWSVTALEEEPREPADLPTALHPEDPQAPSTAPSAAPSAAKAEARPSTTQPSTTRPPTTRPPRRSLAHLVPEEHPGNPALRRADERAPEAGGARASSRAAIEGTSEGASRAGGHAPSHTASHTARWTELVNSGQSERVVELAEQRGVSACLESCSTEELRALADAARYTGRASEARAALLALRARGPVEASRAAYFLGSLAESRGQAAGALEWYTKSLGEAPDGPFSAEARAGRMRALLALGRRGEAREQAREYLRLHPSGVAAERAQQLSSSP